VEKTTYRGASRYLRLNKCYPGDHVTYNKIWARNMPCFKRANGNRVLVGKRKKMRHFGKQET